MQPRPRGTLGDGQAIEIRLWMETVFLRAGLQSCTGPVRHPDTPPSCAGLCCRKVRLGVSASGTARVLSDPSCRLGLQLLVIWQPACLPNALLLVCMLQVTLEGQPAGRGQEKSAVNDPTGGCFSSKSSECKGPEAERRLRPWTTCKSGVTTAKWKSCRMAGGARDRSRGPALRNFVGPGKEGPQGLSSSLSLNETITMFCHV